MSQSSRLSIRLIKIFNGLKIISLQNGIPTSNLPLISSIGTEAENLFSGSINEKKIVFNLSFPNLQPKIPFVTFEYFKTHLLVHTCFRVHYFNNNDKIIT